LAAIALVEQLPEDHALRAEINERVERWSEQILDIAERTFHEGELEQAIAIASRIPAHTAAAAVVSERVANWETVWSDATEIFATAEDFLRDSQFRQAFSEAIKLRSVGNDYWETTKYEELVNLISTARRDVNVLGQARRLADRGSVSAILEALELVQSISEESHLYGEAQALMKGNQSRDVGLGRKCPGSGGRHRSPQYSHPNPPRSRAGGRSGRFPHPGPSL
jgi:hypothetical protein